MNQDDFRKLLSTPRSDTPSTLSYPPPRKHPSATNNPYIDPFARPSKAPKTTGTPTINKSHVNLGPGFRDRAKERRLVERGESEDNGPPKGLDIKALKRTGEGDLEESENMDGEEEDDGELDELLEKAESGIGDQKNTRDSLQTEESKTQGKSRFKPIVPKSQKPLQKKIKHEPGPFVSPTPFRSSQSSETKILQSSRESAGGGLATSLPPTPSKSMSMPPPPVPTKKMSTQPRVQKKSRSEVLAELRAAQLAKKAFQPTPPTTKDQEEEGMWSDEDELSDYDPFHDLQSDEDGKKNNSTLKDDKEIAEKEDQDVKKRNYFVDSDNEDDEGGILKPGPLKLDPTIAAALRKASQYQQQQQEQEEVSSSMLPPKVKRVNPLGVITEEDEEEETVQSKKRMRLGSKAQESDKKSLGMSLLSEGEAYDDLGREDFGVWGDDDEDIGKRKRKRH